MQVEFHITLTAPYHCSSELGGVKKKASGYVKFLEFSKEYLAEPSK